MLSNQSQHNSIGMHYGYANFITTFLEPNYFKGFSESVCLKMCVFAKTQNNPGSDSLALID